jgi:3-oxoacyl-[acyl-carrier-protein] synthase-3
MKAYIKAIDYYLPERVVTNDDLAREFPDWDVNKFSVIGVTERHVAAPDETSMDMAVKAANKLFSQASGMKESVDFILSCTNTADYILPPNVCLIHDRLGFPTKVGGLEYRYGCSGYIYGLSLAKGLIAAGIAKNILLLTAETISKIMHPQDITNRIIFGDAASATLISTDGFAEIGQFCLGIDGSKAEYIIVKNGGLRHPEKENLVTYNKSNVLISPDHIYAAGMELFYFYIKTVPALIKDVLLKNNITQDETDLFVFQQPTKYILDNLQKVIKIDEQKFCRFHSTVGNTAPSSIPMVLYEAMKEGKYKQGMKTLLAGFGMGMSYGGVLLI